MNATGATLMKCFRLFTALASVMLMPTAHAEPATYAIDPAQTKVYWEVSHMGTSTHRGRFDTIDGSVVLDRSAGQGEVSITVATASVSSGVPALDTVLRGNDFLDSAAHPSAYFVSRQFKVSGERLVSLSGEFTLRGVSRALELRSNRFVCGIDARSKQEVCGGDFEAEILRSDFGSTYGLPFVGDKVRLLISIEGTRK